MKRIADQIKQALSALAQADAGEVSGRYRMEAALNAQPEYAPAAAAEAPRRLVALGVGETLPAAVVEYVIGVCRRMQADLLFLSADPDRVRRLIAPHLAALQGLRCETEPLAAPSRKEVLRVLQRRSGVLFAVTGAADDPVRTLVKGRGGLFDRRTPVPVVVVGAQPLRSPASTRAPRPPERPLPALISQP